MAPLLGLPLSFCHNLMLCLRRSSALKLVGPPSRHAKIGHTSHMLSCVQMQDFAEVTFQHLAPVCASARGDALLLLTRHADIFAGRLPRDPCTRVLLPLLARAADQGLALSPLPPQHVQLVADSSRIMLLLMLAVPSRYSCLPCKTHARTCCHRETKAPAVLSACLDCASVWPCLAVTSRNVPSLLMC